MRILTVPSILLWHTTWYVDVRLPPLALPNVLEHGKLCWGDWKSSDIVETKLLENIKKKGEVEEMKMLKGIQLVDSNSVDG